MRSTMPEFDILVIGDSENEPLNLEYETKKIGSNHV